VFSYFSLYFIFFTQRHSFALGMRCHRNQSRIVGNASSIASRIINLRCVQEKENVTKTANTEFLLATYHLHGWKMTYATSFVPMVRKLYALCIVIANEHCIGTVVDVQVPRNREQRQLVSSL